MRKFLLSGVAAVAAAFAIVSQAQAITIGVPENVGPWGLAASLPPQQRGIYADISDALAKAINAPIETRFLPYGRMLQDIRSGSVDYAFGVISPTTSEAAPFVGVLATVSMVAVGRKDLKLRSLDDLRGFKQIGYLRGGSCGKDVDADPEIHREAQDSYETAIRKLAAGRLDGWCSIKAGFTYALANLKMQDQIGSQVDYGNVQLGLQATRAKADAPETKMLTASLDQLVQDGTTRQIFARYLGVADHY